jgi:hypothetical protein
MRKITFALLISAACGLSGLSVASAAPANGAIIRDNAAGAAVVQKVDWHHWHHWHHRHRWHCNRWHRCW